MFSLDKDFVESFKEQEVPWGPVGYVVFKRTYARRLNNDDPNSDTEEWWQTCERVINGMFSAQKKHVLQSGLPWSEAKALRTAKDAYERMFLMKWLPPGRGIWAMGSTFVEERGSAALNNCSFISTETLPQEGGNIFAWMMDALMLGIGVGFDTKGANTMMIHTPGSKHTQKSYTINKYNDDFTTCVIADSREGWCESVEVLLNAYLFGHKLPVFDYSEIREAGAPIKGFGGTSSGSAPLQVLHKELMALYEESISKPLDSVTIVDTENLIGKCVVSGNVRRSAAIALGDASDMAFLTMKNDQEKLYSHRWGSNNSAVVRVGHNYEWIADQCATNGEPGCSWLSNWQNYGRMKDGIRYDDLGIKGINPCAEIGLWHKELCTLSENFIARHDNYEDFIATLKVSYLYAKTVTLMKTHWPETNAVMGMNRRIGLGVTGIVQAINKFGYHSTIQWLDNAYQYVDELDRIYSDWLCVPRSKKMTTIKPSGTTSKLAGATPGMHWPESEFYINRIRFADNSNLLKPLQEAGYHIEPCQYSPNTMVVSFPVREPFYKKSKADVSMWEQLELAAQLQHYWSDNGVSVTVTFNDKEAADISSALDKYQTRLKAVSFLRYKETGYAQAPLEPITAEEYEAMSQNLKPFQLISNEEGGVEKYCTTDACEIDFSKMK